jgi:hypothetical protein
MTADSNSCHKNQLLRFLSIDMLYVRSDFAVGGKTLVRYRKCIWLVLYRRDSAPLWTPSRTCRSDSARSIVAIGSVSVSISQHCFREQTVCPHLPVYHFVIRPAIPLMIDSERIWNINVVWLHKRFMDLLVSLHHLWEKPSFRRQRIKKSMLHSNMTQR